MAASVLKAAKGGNTRKLKKLLDEGVAVDACDVELQTPLFMAALKGHLRCVRLLIEKKANPNHETIRGTTALHAACYNGNGEVISLLVESGGDLGKVSHSGDTPRDCAVRRGNKKAITLLDKIEGLVQAQLSFSCLQQSTSHCQLISSSHALGLNAAGSRMSLSRFGVAGDGAGIEYGARLTIPEASDIHLNGRQLRLTVDMVLQRGSWRGSTIMVKKPNPERVNDLLIGKVFQEVDILSQLHHPNITMLMAVCYGPSQEEVCIVLEPMKRATLDYQLHERRRKFGIYEILVLLAGIADGVHFVHHSGYIHSYLKPDSILIGCNLQAKLCNFEYAQKVDRTSMSHISTMFPYMAPEQLRGIPVDEAGDAYSFGCILWECLTCRVPWADKDTLHIPDWVANKEHRLQIEKSWPVPVQRILSCTFRAAKSRPDFTELFTKLTTIADLHSPSNARLCDDPFSECGGESKELSMARSHHSCVHNTSHVASRSSSHHCQSQKRATRISHAPETSTEDETSPPEQFCAFSIKPLPSDGTVSSHWKQHISRLTSPPPTRNRRKSRQSIGSRHQHVPQHQNDARPFPDGISLGTEVHLATATALEERGNESNDEDSDGEFLTATHSKFGNRASSENAQNHGSCEPSKSLLLEVVDMLRSRIESEEEHKDDDFIPSD